jgi:hypothetical protein
LCLNRCYISILDNEISFVKSVHNYDGLEREELTFPKDAFIKLLGNENSKKMIDDEEWLLGVYENKIGYFPSIFVQSVFKLSDPQILYGEELENKDDEPSVFKEDI